MVPDLALLKIFERAQFSREAGITLAIAPNGEKVYDSWGFDLKTVGGVEAIQVCSEQSQRPIGFSTNQISGMAFRTAVLTLYSFDIWMEPRLRPHGAIQ